MKIDFLEYVEILECNIPNFHLLHRDSRNYRRDTIEIVCRSLKNFGIEIDIYFARYVLFTDKMSISFYCSQVEESFDHTSDLIQIKIEGIILHINYDYKLELNSKIELYFLTLPCQTCINFMQMFPEDCYDPKLNEIKMKEGPPLLL